MSALCRKWECVHAHTLAHVRARAHTHARTHAREYWGIFGTNSCQRHHLSSSWSVVVTENKMFSPIFCHIIYNMFYFPVCIHRVALGLFSCMWKLLCSLLQIAPFESRLLFYWRFIWESFYLQCSLYDLPRLQNTNKKIGAVGRLRPHRCCCSIESMFLNITVLSAWHLCSLS